MIADLLRDEQFLKLEKDFKFLQRARGQSLEQLECLVVDVETTGLEPSLCELTEVGAVKVIGREVIDVFNTLIKTKNPIPPEITQLTGIDDELVKDYPPAAEVLAKFHDFAGAAVLIAHNVDFDLPFLKHHLKLATDRELTNEAICTLKLSRHFLPQLPNHKLHTVANHFSLPVANRHRAMGDAELTYQIWLKFLELLKAQGQAYKSDLDLLLTRL
jgi:DNA polymerase-3 subunit alpha (Gram-positive type)